MDTKQQRQDSVPEFDFGSETTTRKTSKDTILAELADLHGNNSPEQPIKKKNSNTDFNIFGELYIYGDSESNVWSLFRPTTKQTND